MELTKRKNLPQLFKMSKFTDKIKHSAEKVKRNMTFRKKKQHEPHTDNSDPVKEIQLSEVKESFETDSTLTHEETAIEQVETVTQEIGMEQETAAQEIVMEQEAVTEQAVVESEPQIKVPAEKVVTVAVTKIPAADKPVAKRKWWVPLTIFGWLGAVGTIGILVFAKQTNFFKHI
ncbi:hypothetical protein HDV01_002237 [Terramyces sp. JEL0728]|nr:hypothetical protein HDV01_002237 [Terramyces sp. JEL0728]